MKLIFDDGTKYDYVKVWSEPGEKWLRFEIQSVNMDRKDVNAETDLDVASIVDLRDTLTRWLNENG